MSKATRAQLVAALQGLKVIVDCPDSSVSNDGRGWHVTGTLRYPADVADEAYARLRREPDDGRVTELDRAYVINGDDLRMALGPLSPGNSPRAEAERILRQIEVLGATVVTERTLAAALSGIHITVRDEFGQATTGTVLVPDVVAKALMSQLSANAAHDDDVVDAHICCEHADGHGPIGDREVQLMADILRGMAGLDPDARQRIRNWVDERFVPRNMPF